MTIYSAIENSIRTLFDEYFSDPTLYLRESNQQFRLNQLILENLIAETGKNTIDAKITPSINGYANPDSKIKQSQTELKIDYPGSPANSRSDIIVFKDQPITLNREKNGPLDITAKILANDVAGVIELKSAPSANSSIPRGLVSDVEKLLDLVRSIPDKIDAHFVNFDKSIGINGHSSSRKAPVNWWSGQSFEVSNNKPKQKYIIIWDIEASAGNAPTIRKRFAY
jgi:hypothetical protein